MSDKQHEISLRDQGICEMRREGMTLAEIGRRLSISRERVRQICDRYGIVPPPTAYVQKWPIPYFSERMKKYLWNAGYRRCGACQIWQEQVTATNRRCPECNRKVRLQRYNTPAGQEYAKRYRKEHPEVNKAADEKWFAKIKSDPFRYSQYLARLREYYRERVSTKEGREAFNAYYREYYKKRKQISQQGGSAG